MDEEEFVVGHGWEMFVEKFGGTGEVVVFEDGGECGLGGKGWRDIFLI